MSIEIYWLTLTTLLTPLLIVPYAVVRISRIGIATALRNPLPGDDPLKEEWAHRAYRAHMNGLENLIIFAPLAIAVQVTGTSNEVTQLASAVYFFARLVHAPFYVLKTPYVRTVAWFIGIAACFTLGYQLLVVA